MSEHKLKDTTFRTKLCPECGLAFYKHVIEIGCPVSDVDEKPKPKEKKP